MNSIIAKIVAWSLVTAAISLAGFAWTTATIDRRIRGRMDFFGKTQILQVEGAQRAHEDGGREKLAAYLRRLDDLFQAEHALVDSSGVDLETGADRSAQLARAADRPGPPRPYGDRMLLASPPTARGWRLLILVHPPPEAADIVPYYLWILVAVLGLGYALAIYLVRPIRTLRRAVERFGQGDLRTRISLPRRDEIGQLSRSFDEMADRIETLLTAERRLLQDVSHELRSPLARLKFAVDLARSGDDLPRSLDRIDRDVGRLSDLVGELLQLTRSEGDPSTRDREDVDIPGLVAELVEESRLEADARGCAIRWEAARVPSIRGDAKLLRRAIENVVRNAIRHAPEGSAIDVGVSEHEDQVRIDVRDRGEGVPEPAIGSIFEPFFRVESDRARSSGGVGLGLAIARRALAVHGGSIRAANSHPGLRVTMTLPLRGTAVDGPPRPVS